MDFDIVKCSKADADEWILQRAVALPNGIKESSDCESLWNSLVQLRQGQFLFQCQAIWGIAPQEVNSLTYGKFVLRVTNSSKIDVGCKTLSAKDIATVVDIAAEVAEEDERDEESHFATTYLLLSRTFIRYGCLVDEVALRLSSGRPKLRTLVLCWAVCIAIATTIPVTGSMYLTPTGALLTTCAAWFCSVLFAWCLFSGSPMRDDVCYLKPEGLGRSFFTQAAIAMVRSKVSDTEMAE